jgi:hypothetical protein
LFLLFFFQQLSAYPRGRPADESPDLNPRIRPVPRTPASPSPPSPSRPA